MADLPDRIYRELFRGAPIGLAVLDAHGCPVQCNAALEAMFGSPAAELCVTPLAERADPAHRAQYLARLGELLAGTRATFTMESRFLPLDGGDLWATVAVARLRGDEAAAPRFVAVLQDVTDRKAMERHVTAQAVDLQHRSKLEVVGRLAGSIAHDFNNLLTVIMAHTELLTQALSPDDPNHADALAALAAARRATALIREMMDFSRKESVPTGRVELNAVLRDALPLLEEVTGSGVRVKLGLDAAPLCAQADAGALERVLLNLAANARDAMPGGGVLRVECARLGDDAVVTVRDTGSGMDDATRARIFEPFFTTKPRGIGTGLGLATVFAVVEQYGGRIAVDSVVGRGTTFRIHLPLIEPGARES